MSIVSLHYRWRIMYKTKGKANVICLFIVANDILNGIDCLLIYFVEKWK